MKIRKSFTLSPFAVKFLEDMAVNESQSKIVESLIIDYYLRHPKFELDYQIISHENGDITLKR